MNIIDRLNKPCLKTERLNPRTDGGLGQLRTDAPPEISKTKQRSEKRQTAFESLGEGLQEVFRFLRYLEKNLRGGGRITAPPVGARVKFQEASGLISGRA